MTQSAKNERLAHAYLFVGPSQIGKKTLALELAKWLLCEKKSSPALLYERREQKAAACDSCRSCVDINKNQHPDVFILSPRQEEKKGVIKTFEIGIGEIRELRHRLSLFSFGAKYKIAIIDEADNMSREAANAFLKTLEEPTKDSLIFLISSSWQALLATILSRCQLIKFLPVPESEMIKGLEATVGKKTNLEKIVKLAVNRPGRALALLNDSEIAENQRLNEAEFKKILKSDLAGRWDLARDLSQNIESAQKFLSQWQLWLRDRLLEISGCENLMIGEKFGAAAYSKANLLNSIKEIQKTQSVLANPSFNSRIALEVMMIRM